MNNPPHLRIGNADTEFFYGRLHMIDTHIHLYDPAWGNYEWPPAGSAWHRVISAGQFRKAAGDA